MFNTDVLVGMRYLIKMMLLIVTIMMMMRNVLIMIPEYVCIADTQLSRDNAMVQYLPSNSCNIDIHIDIFIDIFIYIGIHIVIK